MLNFNVCTLIWDLGCPVVDSYTTYLTLGKGLSISIFILVFIIILMGDSLFYLNFDYLMEDLIEKPKKSCVIDLIETSNYFKFYNKYLKDLNMMFKFIGCTLLGYTFIIHSFIVGMLEFWSVIKEEDFYQWFSFLVPITSILFFEVSGNRRSALEYAKNYGILEPCSLNLFAFQWGWEGYFEFKFRKTTLIYTHYVMRLGGSLYTELFSHMSLIQGFNIKQEEESYKAFNKLFSKKISRKVIPIMSPLYITLESKDVIHSLSCPSWGFKMDVMPGTITVEGVEVDPSFNIHTLECAEFCGVGHPFMGLKLCSTSEREMLLVLDKMGEVWVPFNNLL